MRRFLLPVALVLVGTASLSVSGCGDSSPKQRSSFVVFLDSDVTADQRTAVESRLREMPTRDVTFMNKQQAYEDFKQKFKNAPDMVAATKPDTLPESFSATADSTFAEAIETVLATLPGVDEVKVRMPSGAKPGSKVAMVLQLDPESSGDKHTAVEEDVRALPEGKRARFESAGTAKTRLKRRCRSQPALVRMLDGTSGFASYRFTFTLKKDSYTWNMKLEGLPGVETAVYLPPSLV